MNKYRRNGTYVILIILIFTVSCKKKNTEWNTDWVLPLVSDTLNLSNYQNDSTLDGSGSFYVVDFKRTLVDAYLKDYLERKPAQLSGGQRQRVAIGRAIVREPSAFLFDEPLSNLDAALRVGMRLEISELHKRLNTTMIYVTHDQVEAMTMADKIVVLQGGCIEQVGSPLELYKTPKNLFVAGFIGSPKMNFSQGEEASRRGAATIGIRPEHIDVLSEAGIWHGTVGVAEHLGSDTFLHVHDTGLADSITIRAPGDVNFKYGDKISLSPREDVIHKFDAQGQRIE